MRTQPNRRSPAAGYSLIELQLVVGLIAVVAGMTVFSIQAALPGVVSNAALDRVVGAVRLGRESAISQRRPVELRVTLPNQVDLVRIDTGGETLVESVILETTPNFMLTAGLPDTPDAFGNTSAVDFGGSVNVRFRPDGTFTDDAGLPVNGTIFIGSTTSPLSARAVTIIGATGRATPWRWTGSTWEMR